MAKKKKDPSIIDKTAVVYARYSSHAQSETSIEGQLEAAHRYADAHGMTIINEYCDRAMTGRNDQRPAFQQMLKDAHKRTFGVVITWKIDRIGRNREEVTINKYKLKQNGVHVEYVAEVLPEGNESVLLEALLEGMAEYYSLQLSTNTLRGMRTAVEKGRYVGGAVPFGYSVNRDTMKYEIDPVNGPLVKAIFEDYATGKPEMVIRTELDTKGIRTPKGQRYGKNHIVQMLKCEKYFGRFRFGDLVVEDAIPPIITKDLYDRVQIQMKINRKKPSQAWTYSDYLLSGKAYCAKCGCPMQGETCQSRTGDSYYYYVCGNRKNHKACDLKRHRKEVLESVAEDVTMDLLKDEKLLDDLVAKCWEVYSADNSKDAERQAVEARMAEVGKSISNLTAAVASGLNSRTVFAKIEELEQEQAQLKVSLEQYAVLDKLRMTPDRIRFFFIRMRENAETSEDALKTLLSAFIQRVDVYDDKIIITYNYTENGQNKSTEAPVGTPVRACNVWLPVNCNTRTIMLAVYEEFFEVEIAI